MASTESGRCIAIAGASGHLGSQILSAFQSPENRSAFSKIVVLKRQSAGSKSEEVPGVEIRSYDENAISASLHGVDVLVSAVGPAGHNFKDALISAMAASEVKLYIPSEFGVDHTVHDFTHAEWDKKKHHYQLTQALIPNIRVCRIYCGLFLEDSIGPWFGFKTVEGKYTCIGSSQTPVSYTALGDAGRVVARIAQTPLDRIPATLHIGGDTVSVSETAKIMGAAGGGEIEVREIDLHAFKKKTIEQKTNDPSRYLRFLMGEGKINHSLNGMGNDNDVVNPGQSLWKWKTMGELASETNGRPWNELEWNEDSIQ